MNYLIRQSLGISSRIFYENFRSSHDIYTKPEGSRDLVTSLDIKINDALTRYFNKNEFKVYSEENVADSVLNLSNFAIIDPLDGTSNFRNGINNFGTIIGIVRNSRLVNGGICTHSSGVTLWSDKNKLFASRFYKHCNNPHSSAPAVFAYGTSPSKEAFQLINSLLKIDSTFFPGFHRIGSTCAAALEFLAGKYSSFIAMEVKFWDIAGILSLFNSVPSLNTFVTYNKNSISILCFNSNIGYSDYLLSVINDSGIYLSQFDNKNFINSYIQNQNNH